MAKPLEGRVALVVGAGSAGCGLGIGRATAMAFARAGARVAAIDKSMASAFETARLIRDEGGVCLPLAADMTDEQEASAAIARCLDETGRIDILQNNIGSADPGGPVEMDLDVFQRSMMLNVGCAFLSCKYVLPPMLRQGGGVITNVSTIASLRWVEAPLIGYASFKAALNAFTQQIAVQYAEHNIRANVIVPGRMDTPMLRETFASQYPSVEELIADRSRMVPGGKLGSPWDVADASVFLASDGARYINGVLLPVDAGVLCRC